MTSALTLVRPPAAGSPRTRDAYPCAICFLDTVGPTRRVSFGYGVAVHLCSVHASSRYLKRSDGRVAADALAAVFESLGCLTPNRRRALAAHVRRCEPAPETGRRRPGAYGGYRDLYRQVVARRDAGDALADVLADIAVCPRPWGLGRPSAATVRRWWRTAPIGAGA